ncbi:MAG TPA: PAS domain S-box protein [Opitutaceae bacterium]
MTAGWFYTHAAGQKAGQQIRQMLEGFPPTYAQEIERLGHASITTNTSPEDPVYLAIIAAQLRWERANPTIADIYTMRKLPDGRNVFIVDSETDYDRNGRLEGDREQRTQIGEVYPSADPGLERAFLGEASFDELPITDRWGTWVSAHVPLLDAQGRVEAVVGVDYPAANWIHAKSQARLGAMSVVCIIAIVLGAASAVIALLRADLRNRTQAQERVIQLNSELEQRVMDRTAELERSRAALIVAQRIGQIGNWEFNLIDQKLFWSPEIYRIFEIDPEKSGASYEFFLQAIHPEDRAAVDFAYTTSLQSRQPYEFTHRLLLPDGRIKHVHELGETHYDESGRAIRTIGTVQDITRRKLAEVTLRASEEHLRLVVQVTAVGTYEHDLVADKIFISPVMRTMYGVDEGEPSPVRAFSERIEAEDRAEFLAAVARSRNHESGGRFEHEYRVRRPDGSVRWMHSQALTWFDGEGPDRRAVRVIGAVTDMTERKRAEETRRRLANIVESSHDAIISETLDGIVTSWNHAAEKIFGYSAAEMIGQSVTVLLPPDRATERRAVLDHIVAGDEACLLETRWVRKDGVQIDIVATVSPIKDAQGKIVGASRIGRDITRHKQAETAMLREKDLNQAIIESLPGLFSLFDEQGHILRWNNALSAASGYSADEISLMTILDFFTASDKNLVAGKMKQLFSTGEAFVECSFVAKDKARTPYLLYGKRFPYEGRPCVLGLGTDIAERKRVESELEQTHHQLLTVSRQAGMAEFATSVLHNVGNVLNSVNTASACLAESLKKSEASSLGKLVALLREHEGDLGGFFTSNPKGRLVPNYLAALTGHLTGEQAKALKELAELQKRIEHIKDMVRVQQASAKVGGASEKLDVTGLIDDALEMNANGLERRNIQVVKEFAEIPPMVVEKHKVLQILVNLVRNAMQACDGINSQAKRLTARVSRKNGSVRIAIADTGCGIPAENLAKVFTHGFTTKPEGHGFGLHSARLIANEMRGSLTVHSDGPGQGAVFTLELPCLTPVDAHG